MVVKTIHTVEVVSQEDRYSLKEICARSSIDEAYVAELVDIGIIEPAADSSHDEWRFDQQALIRLNRALRLHRDLAVDWHGLAMSLDLIDEVESLRKEVLRLQSQLDALM